MNLAWMFSNLVKMTSLETTTTTEIPIAPKNMKPRGAHISVWNEWPDTEERAKIHAAQFVEEDRFLWNQGMWLGNKMSLYSDRGDSSWANIKEARK